jgi:hypothetical protein
MRLISACGEIDTVIITRKYSVLQGFKTVIIYILLLNEPVSKKYCFLEPRRGRVKLAFSYCHIR